MRWSGRRITLTIKRAQNFSIDVSLASCLVYLPLWIGCSADDRLADLSVPRRIPEDEDSYASDLICVGERSLEFWAPLGAGNLHPSERKNFILETFLVCECFRPPFLVKNNVFP